MEIVFAFIQGNDIHYRHCDSPYMWRLPVAAFGRCFPAEAKKLFPMTFK